MSTVDHLVAACGRLRTSWGWLSDSVTPGRTRRNARQVSDTAKNNRDRAAAAERADRVTNTTGCLPNGPTTAPANLGAIDARERIANDVNHAAWLMASQMRARGYNTPHQGAYRPNGANADTRFRSGIDWISLNAPRLQDGDRDTINTAYRTLVKCDDLATAVAGAGADRRPLATECPACGRRALAWDTSSVDYREWHITCTNPKCRCDGRDCACNLPDRVPGMTHLWLEAGWERLAAHLTTREGT